MMIVQISSHRLTGSIEVTFRSPTGAESRHVILNGVHLWIGNDEKIDCAVLSPDDEGFASVGTNLLGSHFEQVIQQVRTNLIEAEETYFDIEIEDSQLEEHIGMTRPSNILAPVESISSAVSTFEFEFSLKSGDGVRSRLSLTALQKDYALPLFIYLSQTFHLEYQSHLRFALFGTPRQANLKFV